MAKKQKFLDPLTEGGLQYHWRTNAFPEEVKQVGTSVVKTFESRETLLYASKRLGDVSYMARFTWPNAVIGPEKPTHEKKCVGVFQHGEEQQIAEARRPNETEWRPLKEVQNEYFAERKEALKDMPPPAPMDWKNIIW